MSPELRGNFFKAPAEPPVCVAGITHSELPPYMNRAPASKARASKTDLRVCALSNQKLTRALLDSSFLGMEQKTMDDDLFQFPITGWEIKTEPGEGLLSVRFPFLSHEQQKLTEADPGRPYVLQAEQARELRDALSRAIDHIENHESATPLFAYRPHRFLIY